MDNLVSPPSVQASRRRISRRRFLQIAGGALGAGAVACGGGAALLLRLPQNTYAEATGPAASAGRILIAYASRCGSTGEVAEAIGQELSAAGAAVDVRLIDHVSDLSPYRAVLVGSAVRMQAVLPEAVDFVSLNRDALRSLPTAYFTVCLTMREDTPENRAKAAGFLQPLVDVKAPLSLGLFGGKIDYSTLEPFFRWSFEQDQTGEFVEGDYRDWDAIRGWATSLVPELVSA